MEAYSVNIFPPSAGRLEVRAHQQLLILLKGFSEAVSTTCWSPGLPIPSLSPLLLVSLESLLLFLAQSQPCAPLLQLAFINQGRSSFGVHGRPVGTAVAIATEDYNFWGWTREHRLRKAVALWGISDVAVLEKSLLYTFLTLYMMCVNTNID